MDSKVPLPVLWGNRQPGEAAMRGEALVAAATIVAAQISFGVSASRAADLIWEVENRYRFFKRSASFEVQEKAFEAVRGAADQPLPQNILWRLERRLNDPYCKDRPRRPSALPPAGAHSAPRRLVWPAQPLDLNCYDHTGPPRHYLTT